MKSTEKITKAMKVVSAARMRRAQGAILSSRPFAAKMEEAVRELALMEVAADLQAGREVQIHPFFDQRAAGKEALVLVTGDKGLCGSFNANAIRAAVDWLRRRRGEALALAAVGKKGRDFVHRLRGDGPELLIELAAIFPKVTFAHAELLGKALIDAYLEGRLAKVTVIYNEFKSIALQRVIEKQLLPIPVPEGGQANAGEGMTFEPGREELLAALLPRYLKAQLYRILLESQAAELAARMNAMDAASKNAKELIGAITLKLNRTRQAIITNEIAELVGGAEALAN
ncbi:MAG: ATP synthase F1 subunit gamma [Elusimicrobia bacterium]|nr:ATP synthase F1 subunit gamma [Elusimicrobiota bacterium]